MSAATVTMRKKLLRSLSVEFKFVQIVLVSDTDIEVQRTTSDGHQGAPRESPSRSCGDSDGIAVCAVVHFG